MAVEKPLFVYTNINLKGAGSYYVITPEGDRMDFDTKKESKAFIEFYNEYKEKKNGNKQQHLRLL